MRVRPSRAMALIALAILATVAPAFADPHTAAMDMDPMAVPGDPGAFVVQTQAGPKVARVPSTQSAVVPDFTITAGSFRFNADGNALTQVDTLAITVGQTVRWHRLDFTHTVTSGTGSLDPESGALFSALITSLAPDFDWTFTAVGTVPYYCELHELSNMRGVIVVNPVASVGPGPSAARSGFSRPPAPNPSRDAVTFAITLSRAGEASVEVLDVSGRRVATLHSGPLAAGEHPFRWDARGADGRAAAPGIYRLRVRGEGFDQARTISLLR